MASLIVVGAGLAGLACAFRLQEAGHEVEVLEREPASGGRLPSRRHRDFRLDAGPSFLARTNGGVRELLADLGLVTRHYPAEGSAFAVLREGRFVPLETEDLRRLVRSAPLPVRARAHVPWLLLELFRRRRWDPLRPELFAGEDETDAGDWLRRIGGDEAFDVLVDPLLSAAFQLDASALSPVFATLALQQLLGGLCLESVEGGTAALVRALADRVPVRVGWAVARVEPDELGVQVEFVTPSGERRLRAEAAVIAVPAGGAAAICPVLTPVERDFLTGVVYRRGLCVHLLLEKRGRPLPASTLAFPRSEGLGLASVAAEHLEPGHAAGETGLLRVQLHDEVAARLWAQSDEEVASFVHDALARTPLGPPESTEAVVQRFDPFLPRLATGHARALRRFRSRPGATPRLVFAGDYLLGCGVEAALASGVRAAREIESFL